MHIGLRDVLQDARLSEQARMQAAMQQARSQRQEEEDAQGRERQETARAEREAALGLVEAMPRHTRSYAQQAALERERRLGTIRERQERKAQFSRQHEADMRDNPLHFWREEVARLQAVADDRSLSPTLRQAAAAKAARLAATPGRNDAMARRIEMERAPETRFAEKDAQRRRRDEDTILSADEKGLVSGLDQLAGSIRQRRVRQAQAGLASAGLTPPAPEGIAVIRGDGQAGDFGLTRAAGGAEGAPWQGGPGGADGHDPVLQEALDRNDRFLVQTEEQVARSSPGMWDTLAAAAGDVARPVVSGLRQAAGSALEYLKPDVGALRGGMDWAVNRPQTPADPGLVSMTRGLGQVLRTVPTDDLGAGRALVQAVSGAARPVVDVASQVVRNAGRALRGLPTYVDGVSSAPAPAPGLGLTDTGASVAARRRRIGGF